MKKYMISAVALIGVLAVLLTGCGKGDEEQDKSLGFRSCELTAAAWSSNNGAVVTLKAVPNDYEKGQTASFVVRLEGEELENEPCEYADGAYTAQVDLNAADGYCYYAVLRSADGQEIELEVNTPNKPADEKLVNLAHALEAYCHMSVSEFVVNSDLLTITAGTAQIHLPQIAQDGKSVSIQKAEMVLFHDGEEVSRQEYALPENTEEVEVKAVNFTIPAMEDDHQLSVSMEVTLSDGQVLTAPGGTWYYTNGQLTLAVG